MSVALRIHHLALACVFSLPALLHAQSATPAETPVAVQLTVEGIDPASQTITLTAAQLAALPHTVATLQNHHTNALEIYSGVALIDVLAKVGAPAGQDVRGKTLADYVIAVGSDGYKAVLALAEAEPDFHPGTILVADQMNGKPIDAHDGPFKLIVTEDKRPARSVRNLVKIELKRAAE